MADQTTGTAPAPTAAPPQKPPKETLAQFKDRLAAMDPDKRTELVATWLYEDDMRIKGLEETEAPSPRLSPGAVWSVTAAIVAGLAGIGLAIMALTSMPDTGRLMTWTKTHVAAAIKEVKQFTDADKKALADVRLEVFAPDGTPSLSERIAKLEPPKVAAEPSKTTGEATAPPAPAPTTPPVATAPPAPAPAPAAVDKAAEERAARIKALRGEK